MVLILAPVLLGILTLALWVLLGGKPYKQMEGRDTDIWKHDQPPHVD